MSLEISLKYTYSEEDRDITIIQETRIHHCRGKYSRLESLQSLRNLTKRCHSRRCHYAVVFSVLRKHLCILIQKSQEEVNHFILFLSFISIFKLLHEQNSHDISLGSEHQGQKELFVTNILQLLHLILVLKTSQINLLCLMAVPEPLCLRSAQICLNM